MCRNGEVWQRVTWPLKQHHFKTIRQTQRRRYEWHSAYVFDWPQKNKTLHWNRANENKIGKTITNLSRSCFRSIRFPQIVDSLQSRTRSAGVALRFDCNHMLEISLLTYHFKSCDLRYLFRLCRTSLSDLLTPWIVFANILSVRFNLCSVLREVMLSCVHISMFTLCAMQFKGNSFSNLDSLFSSSFPSFAPSNKFIVVNVVTDVKCTSDDRGSIHWSV